MYYGVDEEKEIDCGIYSFLYLHDDDYSENVYYVIVNEDWIEFIAIDSKQEISKSIQMIIDFSVNHKYCYLKTTQIIDKLLKMRETNNMHLIIFFGGSGKLGSYFYKQIKFDTNKYKLIVIDLKIDSSENSKNIQFINFDFEIIKFCIF